MKAPLLLSTAVAASLYAAAAFAQTPPDDRWHGAVGAALSATSGNTNSASVQFNADASRAAITHKITLGSMVQYARGRNNGMTETTANRWAFNGRFDQNFGVHKFAFTKLELESDKLSHLSLRTSLAGGVGVRLLDTPDNSVDLLGGVGYSADSYNAPQTIDGQTGTRFSRPSIFLGESSSHQLTSTVTLKQRLDVYTGLGGNRANLLKFKGDLAVALNSHLNLTVGLTDNYNSNPPVGQVSNDAGLFTGVNLKFGGP